MSKDTAVLAGEVVIDCTTTPPRISGWLDFQKWYEGLRVSEGAGDKTTPTPTRRMREFLEWADGAGIHRTWPIEWSIMHRKARDVGYLERCRSHDERGVLGFSAWRLSDGGKEARRAAR